MADEVQPELPDDEALAAELAIGLLEGEARATALRRVLAEPGFAVRVSAWRDRLAPLLEAYPDVAAPADLWPRIEAAIDGSFHPAAAAAPPRVGWWKAATAAGFATAAAFAMVLVLRPAPPPQVIVRQAPPPDHLAAPLLPDGTATALLADYDPAASRIRIASPVLPADGRTPQLWVVPEGGAPRSLGLVARTGATELPMPAEIRVMLVEGATLAVSLEPAGGSPTGLPTGPIIATGKLTRL